MNIKTLQEQTQTWLTSLQEKKVSFPAVSVKAVLIVVSAFLMFWFYGSIYDGVSAWWFTRKIDKIEPVIVEKDKEAEQHELDANIALEPVGPNKQAINDLEKKRTHISHDLSENQKKIDRIRHDRDRAGTGQSGDVTLSDLDRKLDKAAQR